MLQILEPEALWRLSLDLDEIILSKNLNVIAYIYFIKYI